MAVSPTYPGVYVQEVPSGVRTIVGVGTSTTLFIGRTKNGPMGDPVRITTYSDFVRAFGEDHTISDMARYVKLFYLNGGADAYIMRIAQGAQSSAVDLRNENGISVVTLAAKNEGKLGESIRAAVTYVGEQPESTFNIELFRYETDSAGNKVKTAREEWRNLSMDPNLPTYAPTFLTQKSALVDATAHASLPAPANGFSLAGRPIQDDNTDGVFTTAWQGILGNGAGAKHSFQISIDGNPPVEVTLHDPGNPLANPDVAALTAPRLTSLATMIHDQIEDALSAKGITIAPLDFVVEFVAGPVGATTTHTRLLKVSSQNGGDVRVTSSAAKPADDLASLLMWGTANGGLEQGSQQQRRPAATGVTFRPTEANLVSFGGLAQGAIASITLSEIDTTTGMLVPVVLPVSLVSAGTRMWNDVSGATSFRGIVEKLGRIRDAINTYQAGNPSKFFWKAELWGYRLAIISTLTDAAAAGLSSAENYIIGAPPFATAATNIAGNFLRNVRFYSVGPNATVGLQTNGVPGDDGVEPLGSDYDAAYTAVDSKVDLFNLLVLPPDNGAAATPLEQLWPNASAFCLKRRAFLLMDPPDSWTTTQLATNGVDALRIGLVKDYSAIYFPRLLIVENGITRTVGASGAMAGLYARIDGSRGVWKAPAGTEADLRGVSGVDLRMSDLENGQMNPVGVNGIRLFPDGVVSWGARTMAGSDIFASEYKYIPIRRLALFIEESLYRGLKWVVFEPNDLALWAQIRLNAGAFMQDLFRKGAFQGAKPSEAYFVKCDAETTTQNDRNLGIVNIWVGFAPLKPAEFVILYLQQMAGQLEA